MFFNVSVCDSLTIKLRCDINFCFVFRFSDLLGSLNRLFGDLSLLTFCRYFLCVF